MPRGRPRKDAPKRRLTPRINPIPAAERQAGQAGDVAIPGFAPQAATVATTAVSAVVASDFDDLDFERRFTIAELSDYIGAEPGKGRARVKRLATRHGILDEYGTTTLSQWQAVEKIAALGGKVPLTGPTAPKVQTAMPAVAASISAAVDSLERKRAADARMAELKAQKAAGELISKAETVAYVAKIVAGFRTSLEAFPSTVAGQLAGLDVDKIEARLNDEIERRLQDLARLVDM